MASVAVAAASIEPPTRAEVQDIKKTPLFLAHLVRIPGPRLTVGPRPEGL